MKAFANTILVLTVLTAAFGFVTAAEYADSSAGDISIARQLQLKRQVMMGKESLLATLQDNRKKWDNCTEQQRDTLRQRAYAFKNSHPDNQNRIIRAMEKFNSLSPADQLRYRQRGQWLNTVLSNLSKSQREHLKTLPPQQRAKEILAIASNM